MRRSMLLALTIALGLFAGLANAKGSKLEAKVVVVNQSMWAIHELYLSSTDEADWGPDQLGPTTVIGTGERYTINKIPCDTYDVKLVDEDGDECVVGGVALCAGSDVWTITDEDLLTCQVASQ
jgi:hypothetical protein